MALVNAAAVSGGQTAAHLMPVVIGPVAAAAAAAAAGVGGTIPGSGNKDSRWLTLEVCREFARSKCSRSDEECKYAHPPPHVEIQNGRVMCCFDSIKGKCQRKDPPCKYLHPPQHLKEILLQNGRQNLINKNLQLQAALQPILSVSPGLVPFVYEPSAGGIKQTATIIPTAGVLPGPSVSTGQFLTVLPAPSVSSSGQQYLLPSAAATGYPCYGSALTGFPQTYYQTFDGSSAPTLPAGSVLTPAATPSGTWSIAGLQAGTNCYGLTAANANTAAIHAIPYDTSSAAHYQQTLSSTSASSSSAASTGACQLTVDTGAPSGVVSADSIGSPTGPSSSSIDHSSVISSNSMPYCQTPVYYKRQVVEVMTGGLGRKRVLEQSAASIPPGAGEDLILGMTAVPGGMVPVLKRPALLDPKTGLPVYRQVTTATTAHCYPQMTALSAIPQQFLSVPMASSSQLQRY